MGTPSRLRTTAIPYAQLSLLAAGLLAIVSCAPPPGCEATCDDITSTCGWGGRDACVSACRAVRKNDLERHDLRDCATVADCGQLLSGKCVPDSGTSCDGGVGRRYFVYASDCFEGVNGVFFDCPDRVEYDPRADWGPFTPTVVQERLQLAEGCVAGFVGASTVVCTVGERECTVQWRGMW